MGTALNLPTRTPFGLEHGVLTPRYLMDTSICKDLSALGSCAEMPTGECNVFCLCVFFSFGFCILLDACYIQPMAV